MLTVLIITKPPFGVRRFPCLKLQDWYQILAKTIQYQSRAKCSVVIPTAVELKGEEPELHTFARYAREMGIQSLHLFPRGDDTYSQIAFARGHFTQGEEIVVACSVLHFPRVWWIAQREGLDVKRWIIAWGLPRLADFFFDPLLTVLYPIIDLCGLKFIFWELVSHRRRAGRI